MFTVKQTIDELQAAHLKVLVLLNILYPCFIVLYGTKFYTEFKYKIHKNITHMHNPLLTVMTKSFSKNFIYS